MPSVYLAGPIAGKEYGSVVNWRLWFQEQVGSNYPRQHIVAYSPMRAKDYLRYKTIQESYEDAGYALSTNDAITARDRFDVMRCDVVVANFLGATQVSRGTFIEMGWADAYRKPVILIIDDSNVNNHPMLESIAAVKVSTLEAAVKAVKGFLLP